MKANPGAKAPWDQPNFKAPSGKVFSPTGMMVWPAANALYRRETYDNYPAARAILSSVYEGLQLPMDLALAVESRYFAKILRSKEAAAMIRSLFLSMGELNKGARRPAGEPASSLKRIGVIGAGFMGAGVAYVTASAGLEVVLIDRDQESADKGKAYSEKLISSQIAKGRAKSADRDALLSRITATADYAALKGCDLVVEAVFEDRGVKTAATRRAQEAVGADVVFASNTSTLPITSLAEISQKPENFIGIHFFSPVDKMMLVEIIMGEKTGPKALATAIDYVRAIRKTPIVVNDCRGFFANRCVANYIREGHLMLMEGVPPAMIENAARMAGMPVGPLSLNDEVALDLSWKVLQATMKDLGPNAVDPAAGPVGGDHGREGRPLRAQDGKGFYDYPAQGPKTLWPGLAGIAGKALDPDTISVQDLKDRLLYTQALEAARTMEEKVVTDPREADVGSILGFGFAPFTGGVLSMIDGVSAKAFVARAKELGGQIRAALRAGRGAGGDGRKGRQLLREGGEAEGGVILAACRPRESGDPDSAIRPPLDSRIRGNDRCSFTQPACKSVPDAAHRRYKDAPSRHPHSARRRDRARRAGSRSRPARGLASSTIAPESPPSARCSPG